MMTCKKLVLIIIIFVISTLLSSENWDLSLLNEIQYTEENNLEYIHFASPSSLNDSLITFFYGAKHFFFNTNSYQTNSFGKEGRGPCEFIDPTNLIEIKNRKYCIDNRKKSIMSFNQDNVLQEEKKINYSSRSIANVQDTYVVTLRIPYGLNDKILSFYDLEGDLIKEECVVFSKILNYNSFPKLSFIYASSQLISQENEIYLMFHWLPCLIRYSVETEEQELVDFEKQLSFKPTRPELNIDKNNTFVAGVYYQYAIQNNKNNIIVFCHNRKSLNVKHENSNTYLFKIDTQNYSIEFIELFVKNKRIMLSSNFEIMIIKQKLFLFDEKNEILRIYKILKG